LGVAACQHFGIQQIGLAPVVRRLALVLIVIVMASPSWAQQDQAWRQVQNLPWQTYPAVGMLGSVAQVPLRADLRYLDSASTSRFLELNGNPPRANQYTLAPRTLDWFAIFAFESSGYVRDDERLDPDELLKTLRQQNTEAIAERRKLNLPILRMDGWAVPPHYDVQTRRLEWGTRLIDDDDGSVTVNYLIRILGRSGVMSVILVSSPEELDANIQKFHAALRGFSFIKGEAYTEFRQGDKISQYGLAALVVGGAAAAAASTGIMKGFGKFIGIGVIAVLAAIGSFFKKLFGKKTPQT
jgi:uncharacterized membrane-anchored protein